MASLAEALVDVIQRRRAKPTDTGHGHGPGHGDDRPWSKVPVTCPDCGDRHWHRVRPDTPTPDAPAGPAVPVDPAVDDPSAP